jgi:hypothetical protein
MMDPIVAEFIVCLEPETILCRLLAPTTKRVPRRTKKAMNRREMGYALGRAQQRRLRRLRGFEIRRVPFIVHVQT